MNKKMFFDGDVTIARFDKQTLPYIESMIQKQLSFYWLPQEVDISKDKHDFRNLAPHEQHIFTSNLKYQILMDSVQGRSPNLAFLNIVSLPELECWIETWSFFETIHSRSYTHIIKNIYPEPSAVLDSIEEEVTIKARANDICEDYDNLIKTPNLKNLYLCLVSVYILEAVRFYASFACSFAFAMHGSMEGNAKILKLIARDESLHAKTVEYMIKVFVKESVEQRDIANSCTGIVQEMFEAARRQEKKWARYLFKDGSLLGLNEEILGQYIDHLVNSKMRNLGFDMPKISNPLGWLKHWFSSESTQPAPQETEISEYLQGAVNNDLNIHVLRDAYAKKSETS